MFDETTLAVPAAHVRSWVRVPPTQMGQYTHLLHTRRGRLERGRWSSRGSPSTRIYEGLHCMQLYTNIDTLKLRATGRVPRTMRRGLTEVLAVSNMEQSSHVRPTESARCPGRGGVLARWAHGECSRFRVLRSPPKLGPPGVLTILSADKCSRVGSTKSVPGPKYGGKSMCRAPNMEGVLPTF